VSLRIRGILFDMDNTLLQSRIDFAAMKRDIYELLREQGLVPPSLPLQEHTTSTLLGYAKQQGMSAAQEEAAMALATRHELIGMEGAGLEPGAAELLERLHGRCRLAIVTNNAEAAAREALRNTEIIDYFDVIAGREQMTALKPSPSGCEYVLSRYPDLPPAAWLSVGDSWIDGKASALAGIPFLSYKTPTESMIERGVQPVARLDHLSELARYLS
jgi:phosphoglycolate phosphatase